MSTYAVLVLNKALIITTDSDEEEQAVDVLKAMDPLLSF
jgi:hypothetical protein